MQSFPALPQSGVILCWWTSRWVTSASRQLAGLQYQPIPLILRLAFTDPIRTAWIWGAEPEGLSFKSALLTRARGYCMLMTQMEQTCKYTVHLKIFQFFKIQSTEVTYPKHRASESVTHCAYASMFPTDVSGAPMLLWIKREVVVKCVTEVRPRS